MCNFHKSRIFPADLAQYGSYSEELRCFQTIQAVSADSLNPSVPSPNFIARRHYGQTEERSSHLCNLIFDENSPTESAFYGHALFVREGANYHFLFVLLAWIGGCIFWVFGAWRNERTFLASLALVLISIISLLPILDGCIPTLYDILPTWLKQNVEMSFEWRQIPLSLRGREEGAKSGGQSTTA
jgi:hypothetical protein